MKELMVGISNEEPRTHRSAKEVIDEAMEIAKGIPAMRVYPTIPVGNWISTGWTISFEDNDYKAKARGSEALLREVKEAKAFWEALQELEAKEQADAKRKAVRLDEEDEEPVHYGGEVIRIEGLEPGTKELLLYFIEHLTIKEISEVLEDDDYPHLIWDELYYIREKLKRSIEN